VAPDAYARSIGDLLFKRAAPRPASPAAAEQDSGGASGEPFPAKAFRRFLATLTAREHSFIIDLGPVVGANIAFFGERAGCKIFVEDLYADLNHHAQAGRLEEFPSFLARRFPQAEASIDGILCWDFFDYLDPAMAKSLAGALTRLIRPGGALLALFSTARVTDTTFYRFVVGDDEHTLERRPYRGSVPKQTILQNRDIIRMFEGLVVSDSYLLKINTREILFRKPASAVK
jgi:hypothetical protein